MIPLVIRSSPPGGHQSPPDRGVREEKTTTVSLGNGEGGSYIPAKKIRWFYGINNAIYRSQTSWFMTFELDLKFGFTFFWIYCCCCCCSSAMLPALQVSCLMCFVPQLIERNLYADDRFIPTDWVGLPSLFSALYLVGRFLTPKKFLVNWETFFHHLKNL